MKNNNKKKFKIIITATVILISCGFAVQAFGIANPAAVYCEKLGYQYIIKETADGQQGFCQFPDGVVIDGWKFFVGEEGEEYNYCQKKGYEIKTITSEECQYASKCAVCVLEDGTEARVTELIDLDLKSTILPWDHGEPINITTAPEYKTNYLFYTIGLIIFLVIAFVVYQKIKNRGEYYE